MKKGFTLIELLVVVLIIGILAAIAVPQYQKAVAKSRTLSAVPILNSLIQAEEAYFLVNGTYTKQIENLDISIDNQIISANAANTLSDKNYKYYCQNQSCVANTLNPNLPTLQYYYSSFNDGIHLCSIENKNATAKAVCEQIGTLDPIFDEYDWGKNNYYRIN